MPRGKITRLAEHPEGTLVEIVNGEGESITLALHSGERFVGRVAVGVEGVDLGRRDEPVVLHGGVVFNPGHGNLEVGQEVEYLLSESTLQSAAHLKANKNGPPGLIGIEQKSLY